MQKKLSLKKIIMVALLVVTIIVIIRIVQCKSTDPQKFEFEKVSFGSVKRTISVTGIMEVTNSYRILSKISGIINHVYVDFNDQVKGGQLLASLDSTEIDQKLLKLVAQLESVNLELDIAKEDLEGKKSLYKENLISKNSMQKAELDYKSVQMKHKQVMLDYNLVLKEKNNTRIASPVNGIIVSREIEANIPIDNSKTLFIIAPSLRNMYLLINVDESDIGIIRKNQDVIFTVTAYSDEKFYGKIEQVRINPVPKNNLVVYQSVVLCNNDKLLLKPGMTATAMVIINDKPKALRVPNQAFLVSPIDVDYEQGKKYVWVKTGKLINGLPLMKVEVITGIKGDLYTEVVKNVKEGDEVLIKAEGKKSE